MKPPKIIRLPWLPFFQAYALFGKLILIRRGHDRLIRHEAVHIRQQREVGSWKYHWLWLTSKKFRARVEIEAYTEADHKSPAEIIVLLRKYYGIDICFEDFKELR